MIKLSVVIITFNEERNIERCLKSIEDIADEILVVDSFSTDKTEEICKKYNTRFIQHTFKGYIKQKNWAVEQAKYDHILSLDADEALSDKLKESVKKALLNFKYNGYYFNRLTNYCGKWIHYSWYPDKKLRLWDRRCGKWDGIRIHEKVLLKSGAKAGFLKGDLLHYSYYTIQEHVDRLNHFSDISAQAYFERDTRVTYLNILINPFWRFIRDYILKAGFLDGFFGLVICMNAAHETFLKYIKLKNLIKEHKKAPPYKICFFNTSSAWGGGEKWHADISERMANAGFDVMLFTSKNSPLNHRVDINKIKRYNVKVSNLSFLNFFKVVHISKIFKNHRIKTIITNLSYDFKLAGLAGKMAGVNKIIYRKGSAIPIRNTSLNRYLYREVATDIIANSKETKRNIFLNNPDLIPEEKVTVIYNGIDLDYFNNNTKLLFQKEKDEIILGSAARFSEEKGHIYLIEMANILKQKNIKFKLLLAGSGKLEGKIRKQVELLNLEKHVIFLGFIEDIPSFMESLDIYYLTSLYEGFGYVMVEAMARYKPVIAFDIKSSAEIVEDKITGFLVEKENVDELVEKTELLFRNQKLREKMGKAGHQKVELTFTIQNNIKKIIEVLD